MTRKSYGPKTFLANNKKLRYAVVGLGHLAQVAVLPAFANTRNSELTAIVSGDETKLKKLGKKYKLEHTFRYGEYDSALKEVDAVYIVLPNHLHHEYTVRAAAAGVHVICEKPMADNEKECKAMIEAAAKNNVKLMIAYRLHFEESNLEAIQKAQSGKLGELRFFEGTFSEQAAAGNVRLTESVARGGGPVFDMGVYCINAARYLFRAEPTSVTAFSASGGDKRFTKVDEMTSAILRFPGERLANVNCSFGATEVSRYSIVGTNGTLTAEPAYNYGFPLKQKITIGTKTRSKTFRKTDQFAAQIMYFSDCVQRNREPEPSGWEGLADVRVVTAIYESARTGKRVELGSFPERPRPGMSQKISRPAHRKPSLIKAEAPTE